jgi:hypothetical protein
MVNPDPVDNRMRLLLGLLEKMKAGQSPQQPEQVMPEQQGMPQDQSVMPQQGMPTQGVDPAQDPTVQGQQEPGWEQVLAMLMGGGRR